ncbi:Protein O-linked-mannose beta-1,2-N-acetylglucosaminyltransferase 1 [Chionoecetes opilio]|uniref:Alpha-1,3-mannosyl-glycoprotein 2-beta-N-acetylglucosaminyltransferase n=1 Tax=Chionoecetes opilio TaxID=41210 RepID=A0A8J5CNJ2_CHIOP|nr:Protein O-linked-mannose beta-1,2-N-acetylglucosaminyltransferase 1 [Chionoecetes opilio]
MLKLMIRRVEVTVSSGVEGWNLEVGRRISRQTRFQDIRRRFSSGTSRESEGAVTAPHSTTPTSAAPLAERGVSLTVLNQRNASIIFQKVFPLWQYWAHWADLEWHLRRVTQGRVVVMAVSVTGLVGLRHATHLLSRLESLLVPHLPPGAFWTWTFIKGGRTLSETAVTTPRSIHRTHLQLPLSHLPCPASHTHTGANALLEDMRWRYCSRRGVMAGLCDEHNPDPLPPPLTPRVTRQAVLAGVPVVVTAGTRHQYLYHTLTTVLTAQGVEPQNLLVVLGDTSQSVTELLQLLNVAYVTLPVGGGTNRQLFQFYRDVFQLIAEKFSDAPYVILLDEDVEISPDFFSFMSQTLPLLQADSTLCCVNGHAAEGFLGLAHDDSRVFRGSVQVEWGYGVTLGFVREALSLWKTTGQNTLLYDFWLYINVEKYRECIFPEVSRTRHYGMGVNTDSYLKESGPLLMPLVQHAPVTLHNVHRLQLDMWQEDLALNISSATVLQSNPCHASFLPTPPSLSRYVFYYRLDKAECCDNRPEPYQYGSAVKCLGLWWLSEQGHHRGVTIARITWNSTVYLVGCPYSRYCHLRPSGVLLWDVDALTEDEFKLIENYSPRGRGNITIANEHATSDFLVEMLSGA